MQDQYGLFLEASKEDRMTILGNILGLGIYDGMEGIARDRVAEASRQIARRQAVIANLAQEASGADAVRAEYESTGQEATAAKSALDTAMLQKENISLKLAGRREAFDKAVKLTTDINTAEGKNAELTRLQNEQRGIISSADDILRDEDVIHANASKSTALAEKEKELLQRRSAAVTRLETLNATSAQITTLKINIGQAEKNKLSAGQRIEAIGQQIATAQKGESASAELQSVVAGIAAMESKEREYRDISDQLSKAQAVFAEAETSFKVEAAERKRAVETYQAKAKMLKDSQCVDVANASCRFLADAKAAQKQLETYIPDCTAWKSNQLHRLEQMKSELEAGKSKQQGTGYDPDALMGLRGRADTLRPQAAEYAKVGLYQDMLYRETENKAHIEQNLHDSNERLESLQSEISGLEKLKANIAAMDAELSALREQINQVSEWVEKGKQLPVATERKATAQRRVEEIDKEISDTFSRLSMLRAEYDAAMKDAAGKDELEAQLKDAAALVSTKQDQISAIHARLGSLSERLEQIKKKESEIRSMQDEVNAFSHQSATYSTLKQAFSQDGIPHNIIRSMLPLLTTTANTILGQMTGGKMGMEFITDKVLKSNSRKEVPTLDIVINEYGKDSLPYLSKSGGEKVKASLSAILSLAEIKSSQAGIQLGMLFIDEPPFLDADGIQAYCDALETIQHRYTGLKVMAITHDPEMKSRFPQSIDIIKDDTGSHVMLE
jgi:exonuclease SbcC